MSRRFNVNVTKGLINMFHEEISKKPENETQGSWDKYNIVSFEPKDIDANHTVDGDFVLTPTYNVEKLFNLYDSYVPTERRLFHLEYDASEFQGILTIDELMIKLEKDHYFDKDFWSVHSSKEGARKDFESYKLKDGTNIAYEMLWGLKRIV